MKAAFIAAGAASIMAAPAMAGPYVNIETNAGYVDGEYGSATTDFHVGFEGDLGTSAGWYVQGGPALVNVDGEGTENEYSGKAGIGVDLSEQLNVYGEVSFLTIDQTFDEGPERWCESWGHLPLLSSLSQQTDTIQEGTVPPFLLL